jgi:two-component system, chemotaxis family, protein-glutamate methylesterase/glutaminase
MPVDLITDRLSIEPNRVFIIPENRDLHVDDGEFHLQPISKPRGWPEVITIAQKLSTASQPDMPQSAIDTGCIDFMLAQEDIALEIRRIASVEA